MRTLYELAKCPNFRFGYKIFFHVLTVSECRYPIQRILHFSILKQEIELSDLRNLWHLNNFGGITFLIVSVFLRGYIPNFNKRWLYTTHNQPVILLHIFYTSKFKFLLHWAGYFENLKIFFILYQEYICRPLTLLAVQVIKFFKKKVVKLGGQKI